MSSDTPVSLFEAALIYADVGFRVHPIAPNGKLPLTEHGSKDATSDKVVIQNWWALWPNANIGIATGRMSDEDTFFTVVDVDGEEGRESLDMLTAIHGPLPETLECSTGAGRHIYFFCDELLPNSASKLGPKIDTRGDGGYVIAPPSVHANGKLYTWDGVDLGDFRHANVNDLPSWIADAVRKPKFEAKEFRLTRPLQGFLPGEKMNVGYENFIRMKVGEVATAPEGRRNQTYHDCVYALAPIVRDGFAEQWYIEDAMTAAARSCGLTEREIQRTWESAWSNGWDATRIEPSRKEIAAATGVLAPPRPTQAPIKKSKLSVKPLSQVVAEEVDFLWGNRLVRGSINLIGGTGGKGKSTLSLHIARSITNMHPLPDQKGQSCTGSVLLAAYEDQPAQIIRQARTLGIDLDKLHIIEGSEDEDGFKVPFTPEDIPSLIEVMDEIDDVRMLIIDPWAEYMTENPNREEEVRKAIKPLWKIAAARNITILIMCHFKKDSTDPEPLNRISGSKGFSNRARSVLLIGDVPGSNKIAVCHAKHNNSMRAETLLYTWDSEKQWSRGENPFCFDESTYPHITTEQVFAPQTVTRAEECKTWLLRMLTDGPQPKQDIIEAGDDEMPKFSQRQIERAARDLKIIHTQQGNQTVGRIDLWSLT